MSWCGFNRRLRDARTAVGMTQAELGRACYRDRKSVVSYELGHRIPNAEQLYHICAALGVSSDWLLGLDSPSRARKVPEWDTEVMNT